MLAGQTSVASDGYENALFPLDYMNCSQRAAPGSYSHCCGHACDWVGATLRYPYYAPFSMTQYGYIANEGTTQWVSDDLVHTPMGLIRVSVQFTHDNTAPIGVSHLNQGDLVGHTGTLSPSGILTGDHVHLDQANMANAPLIPYGVTCQAGNPCYSLQNSVEPQDIFYITGDEQIIQTQGMTFQIVPDTPTPPVPPSGNMKLLLLFSKKIIERRKENGRTKRYSRII